jgi:sigma-B regulation protein RsbU (phosphoserine phosphatase)
MLKHRLPWQEELAIIDRTMKAISGVTDPEELVGVYWSGIGDLIAIDDYVAISRRNVEPPFYLITRSSRFTEHFNPWTQRERLPKMSGGLLGEISYGNGPVIIDDLPSRLQPDDPARFYLEGFQSLIAMPQYDGGEALNTTVLLLPPDSEINHAMIPMLHWQGGLFGRGTQNLVLRNQLSDALVALDRELQIVGEIQRSLLPSELPSIEGFELSAHYETSARAGGDYYDFFPLSGGRWGLFIADVSGHGTPAAVLMAITHAIAHAQPGTHTPPGALLAYLNNQLARAYTLDGTFITAFYAVLDPANRTLTYSSAGHNPPRLVRDGRVLSLDESGGLPLGIAAGQIYEQSTVALQNGDLLLLYTDGITEAMAPAQGADVQQLFGNDRLDQLLLDCGTRSPEECINRVRSEIATFCENVPPTDDQTLIAMRVL